MDESEYGDYLRNLDLDILYERKDLTPFVITLFQYVEGPDLKKLLGYGFKHEVCIMKDNICSCTIAKRELPIIAGEHNKFLNDKNLSDLKKLLSEALEVYESSDELLDKMKGMSEEEFIFQLPELLDRVRDILLYTTSIPYFLLESTESKYGKLEDTKKKYVIDICEKLRSDSKYMDVQQVFLKRLNEVLSSKSKYPEGSANYVTYEEVKEFAETGKIALDENINKRMKQSIFWIDPVSFDKHHFVYDDKLFDEIYDKVVKVDVEGVDELIGSVACKGKARGKVKIVNSPSDIDKVKRGDILLSRNTNPSLMPAIIKAGAIVTDEGGIACHAAIVSRELNKPCIIGTKIATKVLKDGDEVDAVKGIVRILKKYK